MRRKLDPIKWNKGSYVWKKKPKDWRLKSSPPQKSCNKSLAFWTTSRNKSMSSTNENATCKRKSTVKRKLSRPVSNAFLFNKINCRKPRQTKRHWDNNFNVVKMNCVTLKKLYARLNKRWNPVRNAVVKILFEDNKNHLKMKGCMHILYIDT